MTDQNVSSTSVVAFSPEDKMLNRKEYAEQHDAECTEHSITHKIDGVLQSSNPTQTSLSAVSLHQSVSVKHTEDGVPASTTLFSQDIIRTDPVTSDQPDLQSQNDNALSYLTDSHPLDHNNFSRTSTCETRLTRANTHEVLSSPKYSHDRTTFSPAAASTAPSNDVNCESPADTANMSPKQPSHPTDAASSKRITAAENNDQIQPPVGGQDKIVIRFFIPTVLAGALIGKGGQTIQKLRNTSHVHMFLANASPGHAERLLQIAGTFQDVKKCIDGLFTPLTEAMDVEKRWRGISTKTEFSIRILLPNYQMGVVIGRGGKTVKAIRDRSSCRIRISAHQRTPSSSAAAVLPTSTRAITADDRQVICTGNLQQISDALSSIVDALQRLESPKGFLAFSPNDLNMLQHVLQTPTSKEAITIGPLMAFPPVVGSPLELQQLGAVRSAAEYNKVLMAAAAAAAPAHMTVTALQAGMNGPSAATASLQHSLAAAAQSSGGMMPMSLAAAPGQSSSLAAAATRELIMSQQQQAAAAAAAQQRYHFYEQQTSQGTPSVYLPCAFPASTSLAHAQQQQQLASAALSQQQQQQQAAAASYSAAAGSSMRPRLSSSLSTTTSAGLPAAPPQLEAAAGISRSSASSMMLAQQQQQLNSAAHLPQHADQPKTPNAGPPVVQSVTGGATFSAGTTIVVDVPEELIGRVIGRRGETIAEIRQASGARIEIAKASANATASLSSAATAINKATAVRQIHVSGSPENIRLAAYLISARCQAVPVTDALQYAQSAAAAAAAASLRYSAAAAAAGYPPHHTAAAFDFVSPQAASAAATFYSQPHPASSIGSQAAAYLQQQSTVSSSATATASSFSGGVVATGSNPGAALDRAAL